MIGRICLLLLLQKGGGSQHMARGNRLLLEGGGNQHMARGSRLLLEGSRLLLEGT